MFKFDNITQITKPHTIVSRTTQMMITLTYKKKFVKSCYTTCCSIYHRTNISVIVMTRTVCLLIDLDKLVVK